MRSFRVWIEEASLARSHRRCQRPTTVRRVIGARILIAIASVLAATAPFVAGCGNTSTPAGNQHVRVPDAWPERLALDDDGGLWMTDRFWGIARLDGDGYIDQHSLGGDDASAVADIVKGPDGAIWFAAFESVGRVDDAGDVKTWRVDGFGLARTIAAANDEVWFTNDGQPGHIEKLTEDGSSARFPLSGERATFEMAGLAVGPDGALWFTQRGYGREPGDGIGRMTTNGRYTSWALPRRRAAPRRIAAGSDGAMWFTEHDARAIGRITVGGAISEFPLPRGLSPYDIVAGSDGALWFTADSCVGRITPSGQVATWPVPDAGRLIAIVAAPDVGFWLADDITSAVRRFTPPEGPPPSAGCSPPTFSRRAGSTRATLVYERLDRFNGDDLFTGPRIRISRGRKERFTEAVPRSPRGPEYRVFGHASDLAVRDLDGDREPEVMLQLHWNGTHCCNWSRIYRFDAARRRYVPVNHWWGNGSANPTLKDLDADGRPEFVSQDDRFAGDFDGYAGSVRPIRIWSYREGIFRDVTRSFPDEIRRDAAEIWRIYLKHRGEPDSSVRGTFPAWAADQYMLGRGDLVERALAQAIRRGFFVCRLELVGCVGEPRDPGAYVEAVRKLLRERGYVQ